MLACVQPDIEFPGAEITGGGICLEDFGGKIHLTKNVIARDEDLRRMYGAAMREIMVLKSKYDPDGLLRAGLFERLREICVEGNPVGGVQAIPDSMVVSGL